MVKENISFIINSISQNADKTIEEIENSLSKATFKNMVNYRILKTKAKGDALQIAKQEMKNGAETIVAVGGDGTIREIATAIKGSAINLGIIPKGTGNDLARTLNIQKNIDKALVDIIKKKKIKKIDIGKARDENFLNVFSIGFDALVVEGAKKYKKIFGSLSYKIAVITTLLKYKNEEIEFIINNEKHKENVFIFCVAIANYYGGGLKIAPYAKIDDKKFEIIVCNVKNKIEILKLFIQLIKGTHMNSKYVKRYESDKIQIKSNGKILVCLDGETKNFENEFKITMEDASINIITGDSL